MNRAAGGPSAPLPCDGPGGGMVIPKGDHERHWARASPNPIDLQPPQP